MSETYQRPHAITHHGKSRPMTENNNEQTSYRVTISDNTELVFLCDLAGKAWLQNKLEELEATKEELANMTQHLLDFEAEHYDVKRRQQSIQRYIKKYEDGTEEDDDIWNICHSDMLVWSGQRDLPTEPVTTETELPEQHPWAVKE